MNEIIEKRCSCKKYLPKKVEQEKVDEVIKAGLKAPSGKGSQNGIIIEITDEKTIEELAKLNAKIGGFPSNVNPFYGSKCVLLVAVKNCNTAIYDGSCMIENMLLEATDLGLGSCWIHRAKEEIESKEGKEILSSLPLDLNDYIGVGHVLLGYPDGPTTVKEIKENRVFKI